MVHIALLLFFVVFSACKNREDVSGLNSTPQAPEPSYLVDLHSRKIDILPQQSVLLPNYLQSVTKSKLRSVRDFVELEFSKKFPQFSGLSNDASPQLRKLEEDAAAILQSMTDQATQRKPTFELFRYVPLLSLKMIPEIQNYVFQHYSGGEIDQKYFPYPTSTVNIRLDSCEKEPTSLKPVREDVGVFSYFEPLDAEIVSCYHENSRSISKALNLLSKNFSLNQKNIVRINVMSGGGLVSHSVSGFDEFLQLMDKLGWSVEFATVRMFVDFLGFSVKDYDAKKFLPLIIPSWFEQSFVDGKKFSIPGEHSEIDLLIYHKQNSVNKRIAEVKFYLGTPNSDLPGHTAFWRPRLYKRPDWYKVRVDYSNALRLNTAEILKASAKVAYGMHQIQSRNGLPFNSYGFYVCSDSVALAAYLYQQKMGITDPITQAFPLIRSTEGFSRKPGGNQIFNFTTSISKYLDVDPKQLSLAYPSDLTLSAAEFQVRVQKSFGGDKERFDPYFSSVKDQL